MDFSLSEEELESVGVPKERGGFGTHGGPFLRLEPLGRGHPASQFTGTIRPRRTARIFGAGAMSPSGWIVRAWGSVSCSQVS